MTWQPTPVFLPGKPYRQRSLTVYSPWGRTQLESATTKHAWTRAHPALCGFPDRTADLTPSTGDP